MIGKQKCKALKEIRKQIADANDIPYVVSQCTYKGECTGTCPKCEEELAYLEKELEKRKKLGKAIIIGGICAGVCVGTTKCASAVVDYCSENFFGTIETKGAVNATGSYTED